MLDECVSYLDQLVKIYESVLVQIRNNVSSALRKLGLNGEFDGQAYLGIVKSKNGRTYVVLDVSTTTNRKRIGLGRLESFSRERMYKILDFKYGLTRDEVDALLAYRSLKYFERNVEKMKYHLLELKALAESIDMPNPDELVESYIRDLLHGYKVEAVATW